MTFLYDKCLDFIAATSLNILFEQAKYLRINCMQRMVEPTNLEVTRFEKLLKIQFTGATKHFVINISSFRDKHSLMVKWFCIQTAILKC